MKSEMSRKLFLSLMVLAVFLLHQDCWNWKKAEPFVFGFLPVGLAYHAGYAVLAAIMMALFGTNMTAFSILGASGLAYHRGIGVFGLLASSSAFVIPLTIFFIGTRLWALGKKFGHMTQVQFLRDRWECGHIGTLLFALTAAMLVPYIIIGVMGGGQTLEAISGGKIPYWSGGAIVALVVMSYVFFGGMRGTAWVNTFQTLMFLCFGSIAFVLIG